MKKVALQISNVVDIEIIEERDNDIAFIVLMDDKQIRRNIEALNEVLKEKKSRMPKIKAVK